MAQPSGGDQHEPDDVRDGLEAMQQPRCARAPGRRSPGPSVLAVAMMVEAESQSMVMSAASPTTPPATDGPAQQQRRHGDARRRPDGGRAARRIAASTQSFAAPKLRGR